MDKLRLEGSDEAWSAMENLILSKPKRLSCNTKNMSLIKAVQRRVSLPFLKELLLQGAKSNINEVIPSKGEQYWPLKLSLIAKLYKHSAILIYHGASCDPTVRNIRKQPPIITATELILKGMIVLFRQILFQDFRFY